MTFKELKIGQRFNTNGDRTEFNLIKIRPIRFNNGDSENTICVCNLCRNSNNSDFGILSCSESELVYIK